jgi:hypothetical protein
MPPFPRPQRTYPCLRIFYMILGIFGKISSMSKNDQLDQVRKFRDGLKEYMLVCNEVWQARNEYRTADEAVYRKERTLREKLIEEWGRLEQLFLKIGAATHSYHPATGIARPIFDEAFSGDFENPFKGEYLGAAIQAATKAIGLLDALSETQYKSIQKTTPVIFVAHSFDERHKEAVKSIQEFVSSFPVSVITGEKPTLKGMADGVPAKIKSLIEDSDLIIAVLTQDDNQEEKMIPSKWVSDEIAYSLGRNKQIVRLLEKGTHYKAAISGDAEYIEFTKENLSPAFLKLSQILNGFLSK